MQVAGSGFFLWDKDGPDGNPNNEWMRSWLPQLAI